MIEFITKMPNISFLRNGSYNLSFETKKLNLEQFDTFGDKMLIVSVKEFKPKRSIDQNSYLWTMINGIAEKTNESANEYYKRLIREYGKCDYIAIPEKALEQFSREWQSKGIGNQVIQEQSKLDGCVKLQIFYGSSSYNTSEMSKLIDAVIEDCRELGITTMTKEEIMLLRNEVDRHGG